MIFPRNSTPLSSYRRWKCNWASATTSARGTPKSSSHSKARGHWRRKRTSSLISEVSHDVSTLTAYAYARVQAGHPLPGLIEVGPLVPIAADIEGLLLIAGAAGRAHGKGKCGICRGGKSAGAHANQGHGWRRCEAVFPAGIRRTGAPGPLFPPMKPLRKLPTEVTALAMAWLTVGAKFCGM